jgi:oligopeptide transport system substrate-binding protein
MLAHYAFAIVPTHAIAKFGKDWIKPGNFVGNGPFTLKTWKPQEEITVVPNPRYWDAKSVKLSKITFLPIEDLNTGYQKYKNNEIDWQHYVPLASLDEIKLRKDYQSVNYLSVYYYIFQVQKKPMSDVRVRKALTMAINTQELVDKVMKGGQLPASSIVPKLPGYTPAKGNAYDVKAAQKLLADAGFPGGKGFTKLTVI